MKKKLFLLLFAAIQICGADTVNAAIVSDTIPPLTIYRSSRSFDHIGNMRTQPVSPSTEAAIIKSNIMLEPDEERSSFTGNKGRAAIYPNPVTDRLRLTVLVSRPEKLQLKIVDNIGRVIKQEMKILAGGSTTSIDYHIAHLPGGVYYIQLLGESIKESKQFIKR